MSRIENVTVIGGGLIGLLCAHYLRASGLEVTLLERDRVGSGAARGNAGGVCPDLVEPLPAPGVIGSAVRRLHRPDSALYIRPQLSADLMRFLFGFRRHATRSQHQAGASALADLAVNAFELFEGLEGAGVRTQVNKDGFLYAFASRTSAQMALRGFTELGAPVEREILGPGELAEIEPSLSASARAGFLVQRQWSLHPGLFVDSMEQQLRDSGVTILEGARVTSTEEAHGQVRVHSSAGSITSDAVVVAAGVWTREICRRTGIDLNLFPGKGYSFSVPIERTPRRLVHLGDAHVMINPMPDRIRVAGTMEFDRNHDRFNPRRVRAITAAARPYFKGVKWEHLENEWVGPRPMTPDGLPAIGRLPGRDRTYIAAGHNMLGLMLAPSTGVMITDLLTLGESTLAKPFAPERIARRTKHYIR
ncbi:FAD-binding oxidoreductase [Streptomyces bathyalis]|uniref:FAD-binding oxidoreductase n=1 Tax=Streptomyces bathyalis TaxID=2710756 RepID=A0A7T1T7T5_9ACTN|nr:FAD-dependent oxidoreductase [Streptomyces bathyalis]QPP07969.1 FAD-binding oxidoreductase [Streptomyces bathyalis]